MNQFLVYAWAKTWKYGDFEKEKKEKGKEIALEERNEWKKERDSHMRVSFSARAILIKMMIHWAKCRAWTLMHDTFIAVILQ